MSLRYPYSLSPFSLPNIVSPKFFITRISIPSSTLTILLHTLLLLTNLLSQSSLH